MQIKRLNFIIKNKQDELERLKCMTVSGSKYDKEYIQSSSDPHRVENLLLKIIEFRKDIESDISRLIDLKKEVISLIDRLDNADEIDVLYKRYIYFHSWEQIAVDKNISIRHIYRIHGQALASVSKILNVKLGI